MFKRALGIKKLERNFKVVGNSLNRSWQWIDYFNKRNSGYDQRISILEKSNTQLIEVARELISQLQKMESQPEEVVVEEPQPVNIVPSERLSLPDKDLFLVELIHQYAAFNKESSIETNALYDNLTYRITKRGLRKKLQSLVDKSLLKTYKKGNARYWFLSSGALGKIKKALSSRE